MVTFLGAGGEARPVSGGEDRKSKGRKRAKQLPP